MQHLERRIMIGPLSDGTALDMFGHTTYRVRPLVSPELEGYWLLSVDGAESAVNEATDEIRGKCDGLCAVEVYAEIWGAL